MSKNDKHSFRVKAGRDDLIIEWLDSIGERDRSYYIREALRDYLTTVTPLSNPSTRLPASSKSVKKKSVKEGLKSNVEVEPENNNTDLASKIRSWIN